MTRYHCEHETDVTRNDPTADYDCSNEATRHIELVRFDPSSMNIEYEDDTFLCHLHTLEWLDTPSEHNPQLKNRHRLHVIESLLYPHRGIEVASWIGPNGEDGLEPPIGRTHTDPGY